MPKIVLQNLDHGTAWRLGLGAAHAYESQRDYILKACKQRLARQPIPRQALEELGVEPLVQWLAEASEPELTLPDGTTLNEEQLIAFARATVLRKPELWHEWAGTSAPPSQQEE